MKAGLGVNKGRGMHARGEPLQEGPGVVIGKAREGGGGHWSGYCRKAHSTFDVHC